MYIMCGVVLFTTMKSVIAISEYVSLFNENIEHI
jgi:hypothetical protein